MSLGTSTQDKEEHRHSPVPAPGPTEYVKNRPRRQQAVRTKLGETTESLDLTMPCEFVGPCGTGAPLSQPFAVTMTREVRGPGSLTLEGMVCTDKGFAMPSFLSYASA